MDLSNTIPENINCTSFEIFYMFCSSNTAINKQMEDASDAYLKKLLVLGWCFSEGLSFTEL